MFPATASRLRYNEYMNFTAIDFETANEMMASPCALGLTVVEAGEIVERRSWLIRPRELRMSPFNTRIHGITADDVANEPEFSDLWFLIRSYLDGQNIIAHNAPFDIAVLKGTLDLYEIPHPEFAYACTVALSRKVWPQLDSHRLNVVAGHLGVEFRHHDASDDAYAAAVIALEAAKKARADSFDVLLARWGIKAKFFSGDRVAAPKNAAEAARNSIKRPWPKAPRL